MNLGTQYYRAPFPESKYWEDDMARMKDAGLNTVQLWVLWGWVEAKPGQFQFDDYDRLVEIADQQGLGVILSTIAEIHPYWIHREIPGSEMIDHMGRTVVSSNRRECHFGLTPGGCFDHPEVWERMQGFLTEVTTRYRSATNLRGWDAWNELRWNVNSDGLVCFCDHTLAAFRVWLLEQHGNLDGLNKAWNRRYHRLEDILPGKLPGRTYTEMTAFEHFITCRADQHGIDRYKTMKALDPDHPVTVHGGKPSPLYSGDAENHALNRGNDWFFADAMDGVGCSSFPIWEDIDDADFGLRVEFVKSAARDKLVWLSEVQGGRSSSGNTIYNPVDAESQQRWIWNGLACGADTILFWCWRDEVFGHESAGFGMTGADGLAEERLAAMKVTGQLLEEHRDWIEAYQPVTPEVGILFSPQSYYVDWALEGTADLSMNALAGYARGLVRSSIPYRVIEEKHLEELEGLKLLILPRTIVTDTAIEEALIQFVKEGGTLLCESECGAFGSNGIYRYPDDRFLERLCGAKEIGRRPIKKNTISMNLDDEKLRLPVAQWLTPHTVEGGECLADHKEGALLTRILVGRGEVILCGSFLGDAYREQPSLDFELFLDHIAHAAGWVPEITVASPQPNLKEFVYVKHGHAGDRKVVFVFLPPNCSKAKLRFRPDFWKGDTITDIISGKQHTLKESEEGQVCKVKATPWRFSVLIED
jgi:beta-galactosidase